MWKKERKCESCRWFGQWAFHHEVDDGRSGHTNYTQQEMKERGLCHRLGGPFTQIKSAVCPLHQFELEYKLMAHWLLPHLEVWKMRKLAKKSLDREKTVCEDRRVLRSALKCAFSSLKKQFEMFREWSPGVPGVTAPEIEMLEALDLLGTVAHLPALKEVIEDLEVRRPELGVVGWKK